MTRPALITGSAMLLVGSALLEPLRNSPREWERDRVGLIVNLAIFLSVSWFLWRGHNWARWVTFLLCLFCLAEFPSLFQQGPASKAVSTIYDAGLAIFLLAYLNNPPVRAWFLGRTTAAPPPPPVGAACNSEPPGVISPSE